MAKYLNLAGLQTLWTKLKDTFALKKHSHTVEDIPVDSALSSTSENPVQNKVVNTALAGKSNTSHAHGLSNSTFYGTCTNSTTDDGWKMLDSNIDGKTSNYAALRAIRFNANTPAWGVGGYGSGIFFGGSDTKGLISLAFSGGVVKFAGGAGSKPAWWFGLSGSSGKNYSLENMREIYNISYHRTSASGSSYDGKQWTRIAWRTDAKYPTGDSWSEGTAVLDFYQNSYGGGYKANIGRLMLQSRWGHAKVAEGGTPYSFKTSGTKNAYWDYYLPNVCSSGDYSTYNSGLIHVKVVCTDDTIEWWLANCVWDTALQYDVIYKSNINLTGNGSGSVIKTNDEFISYCADKTVVPVTMGDGTVSQHSIFSYPILLNNTKDLIAIIKEIPERGVRWYRWDETSRPANVPSNCARSLCQVIVQYEKKRVTVIAYPQDTSEYYYIAHWTASAATTLTWRTVYTVATSTYSATGTRAINGTAVASAISAKQDKLTQGTNITISGNTISATDTTYAEASKADVEKIVTDLT